MKNFRRLFLFLSLTIGWQLALYSQLKNVDFLKGGVNDAHSLFEQYLTPYANSFGADLNAGWYNSAKPHKLGGFDLTLTVNTAWAPSTARTFDAALLNLDGTLVGNSVTPTVAGKLLSTPPKIQYFADYNGTPVKLAEYTLPKGTGINFIPLPMAQLTIGLPFGTDVSVRYLPDLPLGNAGTIGLWGVGGKHSIIQHIPALKKLPIIDISAQGGYTRMTTFTNITYNPAKIGSYVVDLTTDPTLWNDQRIELVASAWTANLIFSETLPIISFYQGIGYSSSTVDLGLYGNYPFPRLATSGSNAGDVVVEDSDVMKDPKELQFEMQNNKDLRLNAGFRIKLGVLTFQFDYTKANYSVFTTGIGISFR